MQNALKFTLEGSITVIIDYDSSTNYLIGKVKDSGVGISESDQSRLFKIFGKLGHTRETFTSGIGLGLHICK